MTFMVSTMSRLAGGLGIMALMSGAAIAQSSLTASVNGAGSSAANPVPPGGTVTYELTYTEGDPYIGDVVFNIAVDGTLFDVSTASCTLADFTGRPNEGNVDAATSCTVDVANSLVVLQLATPLAAPVERFPEGLAATVTLPVLTGLTGLPITTTPDITIPPPDQVGGDATTGAAVALNETNFTLNEAAITIDNVPCSLSASPDPLVLTSLTATGDITFTNAGSTACTSPAVTITGASYLETNTCTTDIAALGGTCVVTVDNNSSPDGSTGTVTLTTTEATLVAGVVTTIGNGGGCVLSANPASVTFDLDNLVDPQSVEVTNTGTAACTSPMVTITGASYTETNNCTTDLAAGGGTCTVSVSNGGSVDGDSGTLTVATTEATVEVPVNTTMGVVAPSITVSSNSVVLAMTNDTGTITVTNTGAALTDFAFSLADTTNFAIDPNTTTCTADLPVDGTCEIGVIYTGTDPANTSLTLSGAAGAVNVVVNVIGGQAPIAIPTISQWSMMIVASLLAMVAAFGFRRKQS